MACSQRYRPRVDWRALAPAIILFAGTASAARAADDPTPPVSLSARETVDIWDDLAGGRSTGAAILEKLQVSGTVDGGAYGLPGFQVHSQLYVAAGTGLTRRVGDLQGASNIEAPDALRLFELWAERRFGKSGEGGVLLRAGLLDLNADFDSIEPAALFVNSSHGIGPDLSRSGRNGPSIFPVTSLGARMLWTPSKAWTLKAGIFDGVPGDVDHPSAFARLRVRASDGALLIGEADYAFSEHSKIAFGAWHYTAPSNPEPFVPGAKAKGGGVYAFVQAPVPGTWATSAWIRIGRADARAQVIDGYLGAGLVSKSPLAGRGDDKIGIAVGRASIGDPARIAQGLSAAETSFEISYQVKVRKTFSVQPDVQYVVHPSNGPAIPNALVLGMRLVVTAGYPRQAPAAEAADPTVPPDGPQP